MAEVTDVDMVDCLVIGAGMSGLLAARQLERSGFRCVVVDKGRGVGGRMANRRFGGARFDHGAQFFTCRDPEFGELVRSWSDDGVVVEWCRGFAGEDDEGRARYRGEPAMTAIAKSLSRDLQVLSASRVEAVSAGGGGWELRFESGRVARARSVVASAPVPQTLDLLDAGSTVLPGRLRRELEAVEYAPCLAVLARLAAPSGMAPPGAMTLDSGPLRWMADNEIKGISEVPALTLHGSHGFSREHFEAPDEEIAAQLLAAASEHLSISVAEVQVHRWRYAEPTQGPSERCLDSATPAPIVFCGDAFGGPRVEGAALSGMAAGRRVTELLADIR